MPVGVDDKLVYEVQFGSLRSHLQYLEQQKIVRNAFITEVYARLTGKTVVQKGEYQFSGMMSSREVLNMLGSGKSVSRPITFKEGINIFEMADLIQAKGIATKKDFINKVQDAELIQELLGAKYSSLEGYLYPETYFYQKGMSVETLIRAQVRQYLAAVQKIAPDLNNNPTLRNKMTTLASMVEKETGASEERPAIASVFYNRIKKGMKLQSDPTIIYGIALEKGDLIRNIKRSDILHKSAYNTYVIKGLPIGPIANPGIEALRAVMKPATTEYLYFVSMNEGRHYFSKTYEEHNKAVKDYQINRKAREGKSWRHLNDPSKKKNTDSLQK